MPLIKYVCSDCLCQEQIYMHHNDALPSVPCNECAGKMYKVEE